MIEMMLFKTFAIGKHVNQSMSVACGASFVSIVFASTHPFPKIVVACH